MGIQLCTPFHAVPLVRMQAYHATPASHQPPPVKGARYHALQPTSRAHPCLCGDHAPADRAPCSSPTSSSSLPQTPSTAHQAAQS